MYQQDWIMRQIRSMTQAIARIIFKKETVEYDITDKTNTEATNWLYKELLNLIENLNINQAENLLFEKLETHDMKYLEIAIDFYERLNELSDEQLKKGDFTREEIKIGLNDVLKLFGINVSDVLI